MCVDIYGQAYLSRCSQTLTMPVDTPTFQVRSNPGRQLTAPTVTLSDSCAGTGGHPWRFQSLTTP